MKFDFDILSKNIRKIMNGCIVCKLVLARYSLFVSFFFFSSFYGSLRNSCSHFFFFSLFEFLLLDIGMFKERLINSKKKCQKKKEKEKENSMSNKNE